MKNLKTRLQAFRAFVCFFWRNKNEATPICPYDDVKPFASGASPNYSWWICTPTCGVPVWRRLCLSAGRWHKSWGRTWCSRPAPIHHRADGGRLFPRQPLLQVSAPGRSVPKCWAHKMTVFLNFSINGYTTLGGATAALVWLLLEMAFRQKLTDFVFFIKTRQRAVLHWFFVGFKNRCSQ